MTLGEMLDELRGNILRDRSDIIAGDSDALWSDKTLLSYIRDGARRFAREVMYLRDGSVGGPYTTIKLKAGVRDYPLHKDVFAVLSARDSTKQYDLSRTGHALVQMRQPQDTFIIDPTDAGLIPPGEPLGFYTDETDVYAAQKRVTLSAYPIPDTDTDGRVVNLRVVRLPDDCFEPDQLDAYPEIPEDYQLDVLEWAAYRAQRNRDADIGDGANADAHRAAFEDAIKRAQRDVRVRNRAPMLLAFGLNGFNWTR